MTSDLNLTPSKIRDAYWIESTAPSGNWSENSGKWLLFISTGRVDSVWRIIDLETKAGRLGIAAKVATAKHNELSTSTSVRLICVYTYDCTDLDDVRRVRQRLRELGFVKKISYKTDAATIEGKYAQNGDRKISLFYE
jgi:hypothetical protein